MSDVSTLRLPGAPSSRAESALPLLALAGAVVALAVALLVAVPTTWVWLLGGLAVALALTGGSALAVLLGRSGALRLRREEGSVVVVGAAWARPVDALVAVVLAVALVGSLLELGSTDPAAPATPGTAPAVAVAILAVLAAVAFWRLVSLVARRRRGASIRVGADGLQVSAPGGLESFAWSDLVGVEARPLALLGHAGTSVPLPARELRSDPALVARLLEHYRAHPADRRELADGRAVDRVADDRLAPSGSAAHDDRADVGDHPDQAG